MSDPILDYFKSVSGDDDDPIVAAFNEAKGAKRTGATGGWDAPKPKPSAREQIVSGVKNAAQALNPLPLVEAAMQPVKTAKHLLDTRDQFKGAATAFAKAIPGGTVEPSVMEENGRMNALTEGVYKSIAAIPVVGPIADGITQAISGDLESENYGGAVGTAVGAAVAPKVIGKGTNALAQKIAPHLRSSATKQYANIFSPRAKDAAVVERATPEMIKRGIKIKDPKVDLADLAETQGKAAARQKANVLAANVAQGATVDAGNISAGIAKKKAPLVTQSGPVSPAAATAAKLYDDLDNVVLRESGIPMQTVGAGHAQRTVPATALQGGETLPVGVAEQLRRSWDSTARDTFNNPAATATANPEVYKASANAIRAELNQLPGMRGANKEVGFWKDVERLADHAPQSKTIGATLGEGAVRMMEGGVWGFLHPGLALKAGVEAVRTLNAVRRTPQWRSASAIQKTKIADYFDTGNVEGAMTELGYIMQAGRGANPDEEYLQNQMTGGE